MDACFASWYYKDMPSHNQSMDSSRLTCGRRIVSLVLLSVLVLVPMTLQTVESQAAEAAADPLAGQLAALQSQYQTARDQSQELATQLQVLGRTRQTLSARLEQIGEQVQSHERLLAFARALWKVSVVRQRQDEAAAAVAMREQTTAVAQLRAQLRFWYENGTQSYFAVVFDATSLSDLLFRVTAMADFLTRQQAVMQRDFTVLHQTRLLVRRAVADGLHARAAYDDAMDASAALAGEETVQQRLFSQVAVQSEQTRHMQSARLATLQRLASQISATELAEARAAAAAAAAAKAASAAAAAREAAIKAAAQSPSARTQGGSPPASQVTTTASVAAAAPTSSSLGSESVHTDLVTAAHDGGFPATWVPWMSLLVQYESGGNATAVSPVAVDGEYASGLLQMLPDTFSRYAMSGYGDIWNPVDNAIAAMRYIQANYGVPWDIPGIGSESTYHGY